MSVPTPRTTGEEDDEMATVGIATGAGRGMGYACAQRLATMVDHLVLVDLDEASSAAPRRRSSPEPAPRRSSPSRSTSPTRKGSPASPTRSRPPGRSTPSPTRPASPRPWPTGAASSGSTSWALRATSPEALRPLATAGTTTVCFASMAPLFVARRLPRIRRPTQRSTSRSTSNCSIACTMPSVPDRGSPAWRRWPNAASTGS